VPLIDAGKKAPAFALKDQEGKTHRLQDHAGQLLVLYFYPKDDTPGCTIETCAFRDMQPDFEQVTATVLGVSVLGTDSKAKFANKLGVRFPLLADEDHVVAEKYGAWQEKNRYGRKYMGVARITYLIGPDGRVLKRWDKVKPESHAEEVLEEIRSVGA
jgi:peroxiredoxin Q/BCP